MIRRPRSSTKRHDSGDDDDDDRSYSASGGTDAEDTEKDEAELDDTEQDDSDQDDDEEDEEEQGEGNGDSELSKSASRSSVSAAKAPLHISAKIPSEVNSSAGNNAAGHGSQDRSRALTEEEILAQIHRLHQQLETLRDGSHADFEGMRGGSASGGESHALGDQAGLRTPRLIVVSNRLPVTISKNVNGEWNFKVSSGGLVSALAGVKNQIPFIWVGWTGQEVASAEQEPLSQRFLDEMNCFPVYLSDQDANNYYNGFCNDVLWPLFHYVPIPVMTSDGERKFDFKFWAAYSKANHRFAEAVMQVYQPGDLIWVQDYHLMLLPSLLRKRLRDVTIGFFLHTPFPSSEVYRILPVRNKILQGVLASDLIGFHTYDYARHFLSVCTRILGLEASPKGVNYKNRFAHVGIFPIGIDPNAFTKALKSEAVKDEVSKLSSKFQGKKVLLGVDRLDYTKGVPHKLMAFETLLVRHPEWKDKVVLVQIAVPSRTEVEEYKKLITQTNELVGRINGKYSSVEYSPIVFINQSVNFNNLCALYSIADVAVVTSIRDGMNLVSYEYVMCQQERHGVLVLSEFAGSAQSLSGATRVNPWNIEELASAFHEALSVPPRERELKHSKLYRYVTKHTAAFWAKSFVSELQQIEAAAHQQDHHKLPQTLLRVSVDLVPELRSRNRRLILLDYEGTLCHPAGLADLAVPTTSIKRYLQRLSQDPRNSVYIMSGRSKAVLDRWFGDLDVGLVAEHGCDFRHPKHPAWEPIVALHDPGWRDGVIPILQYFCERTPGAFLELKEKVIAWHFRDADPMFGSWQAKELQLLLAESCTNLPVEVVSGPKYLELRPVGVTRVAAVQRIVAELPEPPIDYVFALGSDKADEDVFAYLNAYVRDLDGSCNTLCCRVGGNSEISAADRFVPDVEAALRVLKELAPAPPSLASKRSSGNSAALSQGSRLSSGLNPGSALPGSKPKGPVAALRQVQRSASYDAILRNSKNPDGPVGDWQQLEKGAKSHSGTDASDASAFHTSVQSDIDGPHANPANRGSSLLAVNNPIAVDSDLTNPSVTQSTSSQPHE